MDKNTRALLLTVTDPKLDNDLNAFFWKRGLEKKGIENDVIFEDKLVLGIDQSERFVLNNEKKYNFVITNKASHITEYYENIGVPCFNSSVTNRIASNKVLHNKFLNENHIPMPKTLILKGGNLYNLSLYSSIKESLGHPFVLKEEAINGGSGVHLIENEIQFEEVIISSTNLFVAQKFIKTSFGKDLRLLIVGEEVVAYGLRKAETDFRSNIGQGANYYEYQANEKQIHIAKKCAQLLKSDVLGVDILFGENDEPIVCEVNANPVLKRLDAMTNGKVFDKLFNYVSTKINPS